MPTQPPDPHSDERRAADGDGPDLPPAGSGEEQLRFTSMATDGSEVFDPRSPAVLERFTSQGWQPDGVVEPLDYLTRAIFGDRADDQPSDASSGDPESG